MAKKKEKEREAKDKDKEDGKESSKQCQAHLRLLHPHLLHELQPIKDLLFTATCLHYDYRSIANVGKLPKPKN